MNFSIAKWDSSIPYWRFYQMNYENLAPILVNLHKGKAPVVQPTQTNNYIFVQNIENKKIIKNLIKTLDK